MSAISARRSATMSDPPNRLYIGDNLSWLRQRDRIPDESVDLIYLDPPFKSDRTYSLLFKERSGAAAAAQLAAFEDTWTWEQAAAATLYEIRQQAPPQVRVVVEALHQ